MMQRSLICIQLILVVTLFLPSTLTADIPAGFVDQYLMVNRTRWQEDWVWNLEPTVIIDNLRGYRQDMGVRLSAYGGVMNTQYEATGAFYKKKINGRWWLVDPDGHLLMHIGVNALKHGGGDGFSPYGNNTEWASYVTPFLKDIGVNGAGGWSNGQYYNKTSTKLSYTITLNLLVGFYQQLTGTDPDRAKDIKVNPVFYPEWPGYVDGQIMAEVLENNNDPYYVGLFCGNELNWQSDVLKDCLLLSTSDFNYQYAVDWVQAYRGNTNAVSASNVTAEEEDAFFRHYVESYYKPISDALVKHGYNHLYLGSRVYQRGMMDNQTFIETYGRYVDVMSFNKYGVWSEPTERMDNTQLWADKPWMATEFYAKGQTFPYHDNLSGAGQIVETQKDRGYYYQNLVLSWLQHKSCVGWHWFEYRDKDHLTDPTASISNKGMFDLWHRPYTDLTDMMKQLNAQYFRLIEYFDDFSYENIENIPTALEETDLPQGIDVKVYQLNEHQLIVNIAKAGIYDIVIHDTTGRMVYAGEKLNLIRGTQDISLRNVNMSKGMFLVSFMTDQSVFTEKAMVHDDLNASTMKATFYHE